MRDIWEFVKVIPAMVEVLFLSFYEELKDRIKIKFSKKD
jgi:hypothetical protein